VVITGTVFVITGTTLVTIGPKLSITGGPTDNPVGGANEIGLGMLETACDI
jgi:hypothetical protein